MLLFKTTTPAAAAAAAAAAQVWLLTRPAPRAVLHHGESRHQLPTLGAAGRGITGRQAEVSVLLPASAAGGPAKADRQASR